MFFKSIIELPSSLAKKKITKEINNIKIAFRPNNKLKNHFTKLKDNTPKNERSNVIISSKLQ